jgi:arylsulfatase A-like enzyme
MAGLQRKKQILDIVKRGAQSGLGFGLLVTFVHMAIGIALILAMGMPPLTWFAAKTLFIEPPLAVMFGLFLSPLQVIKKGRIIQPAALTLIWIAMERFVAVDPAKPQMWLAPPLVALALFYLFQWVWQKKPWICVAAAIAAPLLILAAPIVSYQVGGGYDMKAIKREGNPPKNAPDVVFIVMDTVRGHNISALGYNRKTSPVFDSFAKEGVLFEKATAPATWSLPAHASLFTGAFPSVHKGHAETRFLDDKMPTLAETLAKHGYDTLCFTANPHITPGFGLTRGFGWSDNAWITGAGGRGFTFIYRLIDALGVTAEDKGGALVVSNVANWMSGRLKNGPPAFVFVNFLEAHFPFHQLPEKYRYAYTKESLSHLREYGQMAFGAQMGRQLTGDEINTIRQPILDLYDGGIEYTDYLVGQVIDNWRKRGTLDNTIFVILGDHGEHVGEHDMFGHVTSLYQEDLWVPYMFRYPPKIPAGKRIGQEVSTVATFATIFDLLGIKPPGTLQIGSLLPALKTPVPGEPPSAFGRPVISERYEEKLLSSRFKQGESNGKGPALSPFGRYRTYRAGKFKLVRHLMNGNYKESLFNLSSDPGELKDLADEPTAIYDLQQMEKELQNWEIILKLPTLDGKAAPTAAAGSPKLSDEAKEQLKALGYIGE